MNNENDINDKNRVKIIIIILDLIYILILKIII
jgi:hypothetical protein